MSKTKYILFFLLFVCSILSGQDSNVMPINDESKVELVMRMIGHELLHQINDSTSRILPILKSDEDTYQIRFENKFAFDTDSLISIVHANILKYELTENYTVYVNDCANNEVVFGYAIFDDEDKSIVPCAGRGQELNCYIITIKLIKPILLESKEMPLYMAGGLLLVFLGLIFVYRKSAFERTDKEDLQDSAPLKASVVSIGRFDFEEKGQVLILEDNKMLLTNKEAKLLKIFTDSKNELISRKQLQKEVWEDEGVIVGRSLDMFISKLRKKLSLDPKVQIANVHGKGYILKIEK